MKDWKNIENQLKEKLQQNYPVDDALWQAAEKQLNTVFPIRKKTGFFVMFASLGIVSLLASFSLWSEADQLAINTPLETPSVQIETTPTHNSSVETSFPATSSAQENGEELPTTQEENGASEPVAAINNFDNNQANGVNQQLNQEQESPTAELAEVSDNTSFLDNRGSLEQPEQESNEYKVFDETVPSMNVLHSSLNRMLVSSQPNKLEKKPVYRIIFPKRLTFMVETEVNTSLAMKSPTTQGGDRVTGLTNNSTTSSREMHVSGGVQYKRFTFKLGIGRARFTDLYEVNKEQKIWMSDTVATGDYQVVNKNFQQNGEPVWLIRQEEEVTQTLDSSLQAIYKGTDHVKYLKIPLGLSYAWPINKRFELTTQAGVDLLLNPSIKSDFNSDLYPELAQQRTNSLHTSMTRLNAVLRLGYRLNHHVSAYTQLRGATSSRNIYSTQPQGNTSYDLGFGLNYRF